MFGRLKNRSVISETVRCSLPGLRQALLRNVCAACVVLAPQVLRKTLALFSGSCYKQVVVALLLKCFNFAE